MQCQSNVDLAMSIKYGVSAKYHEDEGPALRDMDLVMSIKYGFSNVNQIIFDFNVMILICNDLTIKYII